MIDRFEASLRRWRHRISRNEWSIRKLGLWVSEETEAQPGLVLVHVEGLSLNELHRAIREHRAPFLARLLGIEGYRVEGLEIEAAGGDDLDVGKLPIHKFHVERFHAELFYGPDQGAAPSEPQSQAPKQGLLAGGSQYAAPWDGGADHIHFPNGMLRATAMLDDAGAAVRAGVLLSHGWSLVRAAAHFGQAALASLGDRLLAERSSALGPGLRTAPGHIRRSVLLRDLSSSGAAIDATRGLPIIHVNFLGLSSLARHARGWEPALRTIAGIDLAVKRLWRAARRSPRRDYDIWVYSGGGCAQPHAQSNPDASSSSASLAGFVLMPVDTPVREPAARALASNDLREAALHVLGRAPLPSGARPEHVSQRTTLRVMTYNVHSCIGMDGKLSPARIARVISRCDPDVVALQELDVRRMRTGAVDQAHAIAELLRMEFHFHPALGLEEELYGDAVLSRFPLRLVRAGALPGMPGRPELEPRGALWVEIDAPGGRLQLLNTHFGLVAQERLLQVEALLGGEWLARPECQGPTVLCGDFNALPSSQVCRRICTRLSDAQRSLEGHRPKHTFFTRYPIGRIDHVFVSQQIKVVKVEVPRDDMIRRASDHLPLVVELRLG